MIINFISKNQDENTGSYRIWISDFFELLKKEEGIKTKICSEINEVEKDADVIILGKSCYKLASIVKRSFPEKKLGAINVAADYKNKDIDFVIVGSVEEYTSLSFYEKVFIIELIEKKYNNVERKVHFKKEGLVIGYHGHYPHLFKFSPFLKEAIESVNKETKVTLKIISGNPEFNWVHGKPNIKNIEHLDYKKINVSEVIKTFDVGVVPNVVDLRQFAGFENISNLEINDLGLHKTDFFLRFKNKTNPGRAYVFYQHGIPVIHDLSPSSNFFMSETGLYSAAHSKESWEKEIIKFKNHETRNRYSKAYYELFKDKFSDEKRIKTFKRMIEEVILR